MTLSSTFQHQGLFFSKNFVHMSDLMKEHAFQSCNFSLNYSLDYSNFNFFVSLRRKKEHAVELIESVRDWEELWKKMDSVLQAGKSEKNTQKNAFGTKPEKNMKKSLLKRYLFTIYYSNTNVSLRISSSKNIRTLLLIRTSFRKNIDIDMFGVYTYHSHFSTFGTNTTLSQFFQVSEKRCFSNCILKATFHGFFNSL